MGLKSAFKAAAEAAMAAAGDIIDDSQYYHVVTTVYDASSGHASAIVRQYAIPGLFTKFSADSIDDEKILPTDMKFLVAQNVFTPVTPDQHDYVRRVESEASVEYNVISYDQDPAGALWVFQLRKA